MTNGCFDVLHAGHVAYLEEAKSLGDRLIVAVNDDDSVRRLKGDSRPINALEDRLLVLAGLAAVDWVVPFSEDTPAALIEAMSAGRAGQRRRLPARAKSSAPKRCCRTAVRFACCAFRDGHSSSRIIDRLRRLNADEPSCVRFLYNLLTYLLLIPFACYWLLRGIGNRTYFDDSASVSAWASRKLDSCIWIHAVSVGEVQAAVPLIRALHGAVPGSAAAGHDRYADRCRAGQVVVRRSRVSTATYRSSFRTRCAVFSGCESRCGVDNGNRDLAESVSWLRRPRRFR